MISIDKKVFKFLIAGATAALSEFGFFLLLTSFDVHPVLAQAISFCLGVLVSFMLNFLWVFDVRSKTKARFAAYSVLAVINLFITTVLMQVFYAIGVNEMLAKIAIMGTVAIWNYILFSRIIFKGSQE